MTIFSILKRGFMSITQSPIKAILTKLYIWFESPLKNSISVPKTILNLS